MSDALRQILASFVIEVDKAGELARGNKAIDDLKRKLEGVQAAANPAARAVSDVFSRAGGSVNTFLASQGAKGLGGRANDSGFGAAGAAAATRKADAAAQAYAGTLKGRLASAVASVRAGFDGAGGGGGGKGPGLIATLGTVRNGLLALGAGAVVHGVKSLVDGIGSIAEGSAKLGVTNAQFQRLRVLAAQNDTSVEALGGAFRNLANAAAQPTKATAEAFAKLGVSTKDTNGELKSSNDLFFDVSRGLAGVANETERSAIAQDLLGRGAQDLKAIFSSGADAVDRQRMALEKLGVLSDQTIAGADEASDMWSAFGLTMLAAAEPLLKVLLPALVSLTKAVSTGVESIGKWLASTDLTAVAMTALGAYMAASFLPQLSILVGLGGGAGKVFLTMAGSAAKAAKSFLKLAVPLLLLEDFIVFLRGGDSALGRALDGVFGEGTGAGTLKAIKDLGESFKDLWKWIFGDGGGEKAKALYREIAQGLELMVHDLLVTAGVRKGEKGLQGLEDFKAGKAGTGLSVGTKIAGGADEHDPFHQALGDIAARRRGDIPGGGSSIPAGPSVVVGDTHVTINNVPPGGAREIAGQVGTVLDARDRAATLAGVPQ